MTLRDAGKEKTKARETASAALRHPMRVRILEIVNERDMSPIQFVHQGLAPDKTQKSLSHVAYHFRELEKLGCIEVVGEIKRRGAMEHIFRGRARAFFSDEEWAELTPRERCLISRTMYQGLAARVEGAMLAHTFDTREDRHLSWIALKLDERGWTELMATLASTYGEVVQIHHDAMDRLAGSGEPTVHATFGMLGFESPAPPPLPRDGEQAG